MSKLQEGMRCARLTVLQKSWAARRLQRTWKRWIAAQQAEKQDKATEHGLDVGGKDEHTGRGSGKGRKCKAKSRKAARAGEEKHYTKEQARLMVRDLCGGECNVPAELHEALEDMDSFRDEKTANTHVEETTGAEAGVTEGADVTADTHVEETTGVEAGVTEGADVIPDTHVEETTGNEAIVTEGADVTGDTHVEEATGDEALVSEGKKYDADEDDEFESVREDQHNNVQQEIEKLVECIEAFENLPDDLKEIQRTVKENMQARLRVLRQG